MLHDFNKWMHLFCVMFCTTIFCGMVYKSCKFPCFIFFVFFSLKFPKILTKIEISWLCADQYLKSLKSISVTFCLFMMNSTQFFYPYKLSLNYLLKWAFAQSLSIQQTCCAAKLTMMLFMVIQDFTSKKLTWKIDSSKKCKRVFVNAMISRNS